MVCHLRHRTRHCQLVQEEALHHCRGGHGTRRCRCLRDSDSAKTAANETATTTATAATPTMTDAASGSGFTTHLVVPAAEEDDSIAHLLQPDVGLGISEFPSGKELDVELES